jgi:hypothetical protein
MPVVGPTSMSVVDDGGGDGENGKAPADASMKLVAAAGAADSGAARRQRFLQQMERSVSSVHFDSARWLARLPGTTPVERAKHAQRLLLAIEPQQPIDLSADPLAIVRGLVLDAAYQLK